MYMASNSAVLRRSDKLWRRYFLLLQSHVLASSNSQKNSRHELGADSDNSFLIKNATVYAWSKCGAPFPNGQNLCGFTRQRRLPLKCKFILVYNSLENLYRTSQCPPFNTAARRLAKRCIHGPFDPSPEPPSHCMKTFLSDGYS